jgi:drug/metabolite transporter (DMT)-like permease
MNKILGIGIISSSTILYALLSPLLKKANVSLPPFTIMAISMFSLFIFSLLMSVFFEHSFSLNLQGGKNVIILLLIVGLINGVGFWLGIQGYKYMPLGKQSLFALFSPALVAIFAYFILGEKLDPKIFISLIIMGIGLCISLI